MSSRGINLPNVGAHCKVSWRYTTWPQRGADAITRLERQPVVRFNKEDVGGPVAEEIDCFSANPEGARIDVLIRAALLPHEKKRGAGAIIPPQHRVAPQRADSEVALGEREVRTSIAVEVHESLVAASAGPDSCASANRSRLSSLPCGLRLTEMVKRPARTVRISSRHLSRR
jgi:hypothetical protein